MSDSTTRATAALPPFCGVQGCRGRWQPDVPHDRCAQATHSASALWNMIRADMRPAADGWFIHEDDLADTLRAFNLVPHRCADTFCRNPAAHDAPQEATNGT